MKPAENFGINPKRFKIVKEDLFSSGRGTHIGLQSLTDPFESIFTALSTNGIDSDQDVSDYLLQPKVHFICVKKRTKLTRITYSIDEDDHARCETETIYALSEHEIFRMPSRFVIYALNVLHEVGIYVVILSTDARVPQLLQDESFGGFDSFLSSRYEVSIFKEYASAYQVHILSLVPNLVDNLNGYLSGSGFRGVEFILTIVSGPLEEQSKH